MKEKWNGKKLFYLMLLIVVFSLGLTAVILTGLVDDAEGKESRYWFFEESIQTGKTVKLDNAYIFSTADDKVGFLYDNIAYYIQGGLGKQFTGVADIVVDGDKISKIRIKPDSTAGTLYAYDENTVQVSAAQRIELKKKEDIPVYKISGASVEQADWNEMIVGTSLVRCVMENGQVCSILIEEAMPSEIHVIIKNKASIYYDELYIKKKSDNTIIEVKTAMAEGQKELTISDKEGLFLCDKSGKTSGAAYEGVFRIQKESEGLVLVNTLPIETYVKYVLPSEMPKSFEEEALKAQAVCARTFAYAHMKNQSYAEYGANLDDSTSFQVYHASGRYPETDKAVEDTKGEVITCNGKLISCYYFSTSAGKTNDMSVWGSATPEYIASCTSEDTNSAFYTWTAYIDRKQIRSLKVISQNASDYITELEIEYADKTIALKNENAIRKALGEHLLETVLRDGKVRTDLSMIPSVAFQIAETTDDKIVLKGGGFGHGIGMSQYGANRMAEEGIGYKDIISHYFQFVVVKSI